MQDIGTKRPLLLIWPCGQTQEKLPSAVEEEGLNALEEGIFLLLPQLLADDGDPDKPTHKHHEAKGKEGRTTQLKHLLGYVGGFVAHVVAYAICAVVSVQGEASQTSNGNPKEEHGPAY